MRNVRGKTSLATLLLELLGSDEGENRIAGIDHVQDRAGQCVGKSQFVRGASRAGNDIRRSSVRDASTSGERRGCRNDALDVLLVKTGLACPC